MRVHKCNLWNTLCSLWSWLLGETGRSLRSRTNGHRSAIKTRGQTAYSTDTAINPSTRSFCGWHESANPWEGLPQFWLSNPVHFISQDHIASKTKSKGSVSWTASHASRQTSIVSLINSQDVKDHMEKGTTIKELLSQMWALLYTLWIWLRNLKVYTTSTLNCFPDHFHTFSLYKNLL